jgi:hypothetical protein
MHLIQGLEQVSLGLFVKKTLPEMYPTPQTKGCHVATPPFKVIQGGNLYYSIR